MQTYQMYYSKYIKGPPSRLPFLNENMFLYFTSYQKLELDQHVRSDLTLTSQNLKFAGQM